MQSEDEGRRFITETEVVRVLRNIERHRRAIIRERTTFERWLDGSQDLREVWSKFMAVGGLTAADFEAFLRDEFRHRRIRQFGHLRLVVSNSARSAA